MNCRKSAIALALLIMAKNATALEDLIVVGTSPLPGGAIEEKTAPFSVKKIEQKEVTAGTSVTDSLFKGISGVQITDVQNNPYQADVNYRGFTASSLLGTPNGLAVFVDGIRQNETFGDVVRWDSIPQTALKAVTLLPGSMPQFGLNALGGALTFQTKSGKDVNGTELDVSVGQYGHRQVGLQFGTVDAKKGIDFYLNANAYDTKSWRIQSPSAVNQLFMKWGLAGTDSLNNFSLSVHDASLNGNGVVPRSLYQQNNKQAYTYFDNTNNQGAQFSWDLSRFLADGSEISVNAFYKVGRTRTYNGDVNENEDYRYGIAAWEPNGPQDCSTNSVRSMAFAPGTAMATIDAEIVLHSGCSASANRSLLRQEVLGFNAQRALPVQGRHQVTFGGQLEIGRSEYARDYALGTFDANRAVLEEQRRIEQVNLEARNDQYGMYAQDQLSLSDRVKVLWAGRFNYATVKTADQLRPVLINNAGQQSPGLNNDYSYSRFNPSAGVSYVVNPVTTVYASAGTNNRVPTPIELACSDPNFPCLLPNSMAADPYLKQVVTQTVEIGQRSRWTQHGVKWESSSNLFTASNRDDILFVTRNGSASGGFFTNFGKTRRQGIEVDLGADKGLWSAYFGYQFLDATFASSAQLPGGANSSALVDSGQLEGGFIQVAPGNRIPGVSRHNVKANLNFKAFEKTQFRLDVQAQSRQYARGNENNRHQAGTFVDGNGDAFTFADSGMVPGFAVLNIAAEHQFSSRFSMYAKVSNVFDRQYFRGAVLAGNVFDRVTGQPLDDEDDILYESFLAPGAPRTVQFGLHMKF